MAYIVKHWRGELPLRTAFWVNGILLSILINAAGKWLVGYMRYAMYMQYWPAPPYGLYIGYGVAAVFIVIFIWQVVGNCSPFFPPSDQQVAGSERIVRAARMAA